MTTAADIKAALRSAYAAPAYAILFEVASSTGANSRRYADAVAMSLWPSHGMHVTGFEIKVYRGDWRRELADPTKAESIAAYCDYWYVVTPENSVITDAEELPAAWGWKVLGADGVIHTKKQAQLTEAKPLDRLFVAAMLRNAHKTDDAQIEAEVKKRLRPLVEHEVDCQTRQYQHLKEFRDKLSGLLGADEARYFRDTELLAAVAAVHKSGLMKSWGGLSTVLSASETLRDAIEQLRGVLIENGFRDPEPKKSNKRRGA
ncbi:hypothetical protein D3869_01500 [Azospirillum brasilense]|uniref:MmcB family DNA repair protein n=1 Tax=Azospirillum brasilense TaxID=192 RepID=A0A4D8QXZ7_AZOBR|nr:hypothetical protein [Azospirillum brasilense]QCO14010.1 hypothetical protein D3869_01500 [Azospirillum brasilense]